MADRLLREGMRGYADEVLHRVVASYADADVQAEGGDPGRQPPGTGGDG
ncbi:hypothetical protein ACFYS7_08770 [Streptomyces avermitilis]